MKLEEHDKPGNGSHRRVHRPKGGGAPSHRAGASSHEEPAAKSDKPNPSLAELGQLALDRLEALGDALRTLWAVRKDRAQLAFREQIQTWCLIALAAIGGIVAITHAVALLVRGTAAGFGKLFVDAPWLGDIAAGVLYLTLVGGGLAFALWRADRRQFVKQREKYEELHRKRIRRAKAAAK